MSKYEIMLIIDPNSDEKNISEIAKSTFSSKDLKVEKLERTELAYEINKSKTGLYFLITVNATGEEINEFTRKANIAKNVWRMLSVNLDSEKGLNRKIQPKRSKRILNKKNTNNDDFLNLNTKNKLEKEEKQKKVKSKNKNSSSNNKEETIKNKEEK